MLRLAFLLVSISTVAFGISISPNVVGDAAMTTNAPWIVSLQMEEGDFAYCGAAIIKSLANGNVTESKVTIQNDESGEAEEKVKYTAPCTGWVVTAASCLKGVKNIIPTLGNLNLEDQDENESPCNVVNITTFSHLNQTYNETSNENDIGLIQVNFDRTILDDGEAAKTLCDDKSIPVLPYVPKLNLNESHYDMINATIYGWGVKPENGPLQKQLYNVTISLEKNQICASHYGHDVFKPKSMICAGGNGTGPCSYDTGGPLICEYIDESSETPTLITHLCGIASFGSGCGRGAGPAVFTDILDPDFQDWITWTIGNSSSTIPGTSVGS